MSSLIKVDASQLETMARRFGLAGEQVARVQVRGINRVAEKANTRSRREIVSQVALTDTYVRDRMSLSKATEGRPVAIISARRRATTLATYGARQLTAAAKRAKGDARRGIAAGRKQSGISVIVGRSTGRKKMAGAFLIPLRAGRENGGNGMGVFIRTGAIGHAEAITAVQVYVGKHRWKKTRAHAGRGGALRHLYGPSVDQVFRGVIDDIVPDISAELETEMARLAVLEIKKAIK